jgi:hypothetical protein
MPIDQIVSFVGALLILGAFAANNLGKLATQSIAYQVLNLIGAGCLTFTAWVGHQYGFVLLEGSWTLLSVWGLGKLLVSRPA